VPARKLWLSLLLLPILSVLAAACSGGGEDEKFPDLVVLGGEDVQPIINNSEIVVGPNRLVLGVLGPNSQLIVDAKVHLVFYELTGGEAIKRFEAEGVSRVPAREAGIEEQVVHIHPDGSRHIHTNVGEEIGFYTANVTFDRPGDWGVEMIVQSENPKLETTLRPRFNVITRGPTPIVGDPAPRSRNLTAADVDDITQIDSSASPSELLHTATIADAIAAGKPTLVLFAVPGFCTSRLCGPELEIMRKLYPQYEGRAEFIHVEFFKDPGNPQRQPSDAALEWNLRTEPWFFLIDGQGNVAAKFEGPTTMAELEEALQKVVR
jgi:hypothetical protein